MKLYIANAEMSDYDAHELCLIGVYSSKERAMDAINAWVLKVIGERMSELEHYGYCVGGRYNPTYQEMQSWNDVGLLKLGETQMYWYDTYIQEVELDKMVTYDD